MYTHALVVLIYDFQRLGYDHPAVVLFESEEAAEKFAVNRLIQFGEAEQVDGGWKLTDSDEVFADRDRLLFDWTEGLGATEYFHVIPIFAYDAPPVQEEQQI